MRRAHDFYMFKSNEEDEWQSLKNEWSLVWVSFVVLQPMGMRKRLDRHGRLRMKRKTWNSLILGKVLLAFGDVCQHGYYNTEKSIQY